jgi:DNA invertase Pin-like site-specific DNA recombinase
LVRDQYDHGGSFGGTHERPAMKRLLTDVEDGLIDGGVVNQINRLSRSLMNCSKLVEVFDWTGVAFASVTQWFNTNSMGRQTLNILLSFANSEREVAAERTRDKVKASNMTGMWMAPPGYVEMDRSRSTRRLIPRRRLALFRPFDGGRTGQFQTAPSPRPGSAFKMRDRVAT